MPDYRLRRQRLRKLLDEAECASMLITHPTNVRYLSGFTGGDSYLLLTPDEELLLSDPRFEQQIGEQCPGLACWIRQPGQSILEVTCQQLRQRRLPALMIESSTLPVDAFDQLSQQAGVGRLDKGGVQVETLREIKDADEIAWLRQAVAIAQAAFTRVREQLSPGQTERQVAHEIDRQIRQLGGSGCSFDPIVAVGRRAALPHAEPGASRLGDDSFILIDWGALFEGYRSDLTRVLLTSKIPPKFLEIYQTVLAAQRAAMAALQPGLMASEVDRIAREVIAEAGMGNQFSHGLGHGIGLDIHEAPRLGKNQDRVLQAGMVVTVEPGIYFPDWGGVRIEDDVLITEAGCERLSSLPGEWEANLIDLAVT